MLKASPFFFLLNFLGQEILLHGSNPWDYASLLALLFLVLFVNSCIEMKCDVSQSMKIPIWQPKIGATFKASSIHDISTIWCNWCVTLMPAPYLVLFVYLNLFAPTKWIRLHTMGGVRIISEQSAGGFRLSSPYRLCGPCVMYGGHESEPACRLFWYNLDSNECCCINWNTACRIFWENMH